MKTLRLGFTADDDRRFTPRFHLCFDVEKGALAQKWAMALVDCLEKRLFFEKNYSLMGVPDAGRSLAEIATELSGHLDGLRQNPELHSFMAALPLSLPTPLDQKLLNQIHHLFELLIGQVWAPGEIYSKVNSRMRHSIRQLNHLVHEYEALSKAERQQREGRVSTATLIVSFLEAPRASFTQDDYVNLSFDRAFGDVFLHYAQLGKTHMEAFLDGDEDISDANITGLRYLTGEFDIHLGADFNAPQAMTQKRQLEDWLRQKGIDVSDPKLSLGRARVARLRPEIVASLRPQDLHDELRAYPNLVEISMEENGKRLATRTYPYRRRDSEGFARDYFSDSRLRKLWNRFSLGARMLEI